MHTFVRLYQQLEASTKTTHKLNALVNYFLECSEQDLSWAVAVFSGKRPKRNIASSIIRSTAEQASGLPQWLFDRCYENVGDLSETIALLLCNKNKASKIPEISLHQLMLHYLSLSNDDDKISFLKHHWQSNHPDYIFLFNKLIGGGFRIGISKAMVIKALSKAFSVPESHTAHCLTGNWQAQNTNIKAILCNESNQRNSQPYPFYLAYALDKECEDLGDINNWCIEHKYDGIRGQIIVRHQQTYIWSRGEELITEQFPELAQLHHILPNGTVIDGEIVCINNGGIAPFADLQKRLGRKNPSKKFQEQYPATMICYDVLEYNGEDIRNEPLRKRKQILQTILEQQQQLLLSELIQCNTWADAQQYRQQSRNKLCEGLMLKHVDSVYQAGRKRGDWWKWKIEPYTIDAVMLYAQVGHGKRAGLYTDYTFAIWDGDVLVPFAKAYSGLSDAEIKEVDTWIKHNTKERFGPVRSVRAALVFELAFEGIQQSSRHKSGIAVRFPRIVQWRKDKKIEEANTKEDVLNLIAANKLDQ